MYLALQMSEVHKLVELRALRMSRAYTSMELVTGSMSSRLRFGQRASRHCSARVIYKETLLGPKIKKLMLNLGLKASHRRCTGPYAARVKAEDVIASLDDLCDVLVQPAQASVLNAPQSPGSIRMMLIP